MKKIAWFSCFLIAWLLLTGAVSEQTDIREHPSCPLCGMDRKEYAHSRMVVEYAEGLVRGTCSIHCTAGEMTVNRDKTLQNLRVADYNTGKLLPAEKAVWVIGGNKAGVMTKRAKWAFRGQKEADAFISEHGGQAADFQQALQAAFMDMYADIRMIRDKKNGKPSGLTDLAACPDCKYCGMIREKFAHSRAFIEYNDHTAVGTCSVHCLAIDLALNADKTPKTIMVGDYKSKKLIDARDAFWVLGGDKVGVMSIRGKWAFEEQTEAEGFIRAHGGRLTAFNEVMKAAFEDMYEILR